jgi:3-oxoacyl-[acyl-carrier-protein] synthase-1
MKDVYISADNIICSLGFNTFEVFENLKKNISGVKLNSEKKFSQTEIPISLINENALAKECEKIKCAKNITKLEKLFILSIIDAAKQTNIDLTSEKTLFIISTTKGNINVLDTENPIENEKLYLWETASVIQKHFNNPNKPIVVSNACISGVVAIITGMRFLQSEKYENIVVCGGDLMTEFVISGFQSFKAISPNISKPFDISRDGISLGEGVGTIILNSNKLNIANDLKIKVIGGAVSNDANHISGPSRTGDGLYFSIKKSMDEAQINKSEINHILAHGTATPYNDEMEANAFALAGLQEVPTNSLKGFFGHTLGAAGIIESIVGIHSLKQNVLIKTFGFENIGVTENINVVKDLTSKPIKTILKTASGFGGCNASVIFTKEEK